MFQICSQLSTRLEKQQAATKEELDIVKVRLMHSNCKMLQMQVRFSVLLTQSTLCCITEQRALQDYSGVQLSKDKPRLVHYYTRKTLIAQIIPHSLALVKHVMLLFEGVAVDLSGLDKDHDILPSVMCCQLKCEVVVGTFNSQDLSEERHCKCQCWCAMIDCCSRWAVAELCITLLYWQRLLGCRQQGGAVRLVMMKWMDCEN